MAIRMNICYATEYVPHRASFRGTLPNDVYSLILHGTVIIAAIIFYRLLL